MPNKDHLFLADVKLLTHSDNASLDKS
jgi:hypothetical protein